MIPLMAVTYVPSEDIWLVDEDYHFSLYGVQDFIQRGFKTDLASVPRVFWRIIAPYELSVEAAVIHDHLYRNLGVADNIILAREQVDNLFRLIMIEQGVPGWRCWLAHKMVRLAAWATWNNYKRR